MSKEFFCLIIIDQFVKEINSTVEDTATTFEEVEREFGKEVADVVREVSDDKSLSKDQRKKILADTSSHHSYAARLVLLADKL